MENDVRIFAAIAFIMLSLLILCLFPKAKYPIATVYCTAIIYLAFLIREPMPIYHYSIRLFGAARKALEFGGGILPAILRGDVRISNWTSMEGIILNILLFIPLGYLSPSCMNLLDRWWKVMLTGLAVSFIIEVVQLLTRLGYADIDDLVNNTIGALIGYCLYKLILTKPANSQSRGEELREHDGFA